MNKLLFLILSGAFATASFAQTATPAPEAQKQGSAQAQGAAEDIHNARSHGTDDSAKQSQAQMAGSAQAKAAAERRHLALPHGGMTNFATERQAEDAKKL